MYLPLQYGGAYQRGLVEKLIARQMKAVQQLDRGIDADTLPPAFAKSAKLFCEWDEEGKPFFSVNVSFEYEAAQRRVRPTRVIGFHERNGRYYYAVVEVDGTLVASGEVRIDPHVNPLWGVKPNTDNYIYAVAQAMVAKAQMWEAYVGIEDTSWKKSEVSLSRSHNRRVFLTPIKLVMKKLEEATRSCAMLAPFVVANVSPTRDCGACSTRMGDSGGRSEKGNVVRCPACKAWQPSVPEGREQQCVQCGHQWELVSSAIREEHLFFCSACGVASQPEWHNTSLVVARRTLGDLVKYHKSTVAGEVKRAKKKASSEGDKGLLDDVKL